MSHMEQQMQDKIEGGLYRFEEMCRELDEYKARINELEEFIVDYALCSGMVDGYPPCGKCIACKLKGDGK